MALIPTVIKEKVTSNKTDEFTITARLKVHDDVLVQDVIDQSFSVRYHKKNNHDTIADAKERLKKKMQKEIDLYKRDLVVFDSVVLGNAMTDIENNLAM